MSSLRWYLSRRADEMPLLTLLAWLAVFCVVAVMVWLFVLMSQTSSKPESVDVTPEEQVTLLTPQLSRDKALLAGAPKAVQVTSAIETLYQVAERHRLRLEEVIYQDQQTKNQPLIQYAIDFTVEQGYPELKAFMTELLAALPYLALEQVSFEREEINSDKVMSRFRFKLFLEREHE